MRQPIDLVWVFMPKRCLLFCVCLLGPVLSLMAAESFIPVPATYEETLTTDAYSSGAPYQIIEPRQFKYKTNHFQLEFKGNGQDLLTLKPLFVHPAFKTFLEQLDLAFHNDPEQIIQHYGLAISKETFSTNPTYYLHLCQEMQQKIWQTEDAKLPFILQKLKQHKDLRNWHFKDPAAGRAFLNKVRFTLDQIFTQENINHAWAQIDPVLEDFTYPDNGEQFMIIRHFKTMIQDQALEFYLTALPSGQTSIHLVRYGSSYHSTEKNFHALVLPHKIFYNSDHFALNLAARLADSTVPNVALAHPDERYPAQETFTQQDAIDLGYRLKRFMAGKIFQQGELGKDQRLASAEHLLDHFNPQAYRMAPYRTEAQFSVSGTRFIGLNDGVFRIITTAFARHEQYTTWLRQIKQLPNHRNSNEVTAYYDQVLKPALAYYRQQHNMPLSPLAKQASRRPYPNTAQKSSSPPRPSEGQISPHTPALTMPNQIVRPSNPCAKSWNIVTSSLSQAKTS